VHTYFGTPAEADGVGATLNGTGMSDPGEISIAQPAASAAVASKARGRAARRRCGTAFLPLLPAYALGKHRFPALAILNLPDGLVRS